MSGRACRARRQRLAATPPSTRFLGFALVGASGTALQYLLLWVGVERFGALPPPHRAPP